MFPYFTSFPEKELPSRTLRVEDAYFRDLKSQFHVLQNGLTHQHSHLYLAPKFGLEQPGSHSIVHLCLILSSTVNNGFPRHGRHSTPTWRTLLWWEKRSCGVEKRLLKLKTERHGFIVPGLSFINHISQIMSSLWAPYSATLKWSSYYLIFRVIVQIKQCPWNTLHNARHIVQTHWMISDIFISWVILNKSFHLWSYQVPYHISNGDGNIHKIQGLNKVMFLKCLAKYLAHGRHSTPAPWIWIETKENMYLGRG